MMSLKHTFLPLTLAATLYAQPASAQFSAGTPLGTAMMGAASDSARTPNQSELRNHQAQSGSNKATTWFWLASIAAVTAAGLYSLTDPQARAWKKKEKGPNI